MDHFELVAPYAPTGDQPEAIAKLTEGIEKGFKEQVLLGVTGSGKNLHDGEYHRQYKPSYARPGAQ